MNNLEINKFYSEKEFEKRNFNYDATFSNELDLIHFVDKADIFTIALIETKVNNDNDERQFKILEKIEIFAPTELFDAYANPIDNIITPLCHNIAKDIFVSQIKDKGYYRR